MNKQIKHTYGGITKDITKSRYPNTNYFSAHNFRITADDSQSTYSLTNEKGTIIQFAFPTITINSNQIIAGDNIIDYNNNELSVGTHTNHKLVGSIPVTDGIVFFTTSTIDAIWLFNVRDESLKLLYVRKLNFNQEYQITGLSNYENDKVEKIYWVDGNSQIRNLNIRHGVDNDDYEDIIDIPVSTLDMAGAVDLSHPTIVDTTTGGIHTAGMIQYAYSLYRLNGGQSSISPMSELVPLTNGSQGGGDVGEYVNTIPIIRIDDIDTNYTNIIVYAVKYTSFGQLPSVSIIYDQRIPDNRSVEIYDDGNIISNVSIEEFLLSSKTVIKPKHIASKDNRLIISNYNENNFKLDLDVRAYSYSSPFPNMAVSRVYSDVESLNNLNNTPVRLITPANIPDDPFDTFDSINLDFDTYKYATGFFNNVGGIEPVVGGMGKYVKYEIIPSNIIDNKNKYFKDNEIYRLAIEFYNVYGQTTLPMWIADFKAPQGNLNNRFNTLKFTLLPAFYTWLNNQQFDDYNKPVGYRLLVADRQAKDKTIVASGIASTMLVNNMLIQRRDYNVYHDDFDLGKENRVPKIPSTFIRNLNRHFIQANNIYGYISDKSTPVQNVLHKGVIDRTNDISTESPGLNTASPKHRFNDSSIRQYTKMLQLFSPETVFNQGLSITGGLSMRLRGLLKNTYNGVWGQELFLDGNVVMNDAKGDNALSVRYAQNTTVDTGGSGGIHDYGIIDDPLASNPRAYGMSLFYRKYGIGEVNFNNTNSYLSIMSNIPYYSLVSDSPLNFQQVNYYTSVQYMSLTLTGDNMFYRVKTNMVLTVDNNDNTPYDYEIIIQHGNTTNTFQNTTSDSTVEIPYESIIESFTGTNTIRISARIRSNNNIALSGSLSLSNELAGGKAFVQLSNTNDFSVSDNYRFEGSPILFNTANQLTTDDIVFQNVIGNNTYSIIGKPEYAQRGQSFTNYSDLDKYRYSNSITSYHTKYPGTERDDMGAYGRRIVSVNSDAVGNITLVPQHQNNEIKLEDIYVRCLTEGAKIDDCAPYIELVKSKEEIYLGGIYGGNSYEDKRRTKYNKIGKYTKINQNTQYIISPGDTYVQNFKFLRIARSDDRVIDQGYYQFEEIVEYPVETTINLLNRNDASKLNWDSKISYSFDEYHKYNRVYSQHDNLFQKMNNEYYVKEINGYSTNVIATKEKTPGEVIDNWLHLLTNETLTLDGKHGPITNLLSLNDQIYVLQDRAMSVLSINPRVQVQGQDGIAIELGSGSVLQEYNYITTAMGCRNKFSSIATPYGIYFYDSINKKLNLYNGQITPLSETAGLHSYFKSKNLTELDDDKPLLGRGNAFGYDYLNNDVYLTFNTSNEVFTLTYTEKGNMFVTDNDYGARHYTGIGGYTLSSLGDNNIHRLNKGVRNNYYGVNRPSKIVLVVNPEADLSVVVNNIAFKSEVYLDGIDQPNRTITHIRAYNEYQDTGLVPLVNSRRGNLQRLFREWNAQVPRVSGTRERIRNPWTFLEIVYDNPDGSEIILHDMVVSYSI